jgi:hypothetical protein
MEINAIIGEALKRIKPDTTFRLANEARPNADYLFNRYLPERMDVSYDVSSASMKIRSTMAGLVAMDSPYPKGGAIEMSDFHERIAKFAIEMNFTEASQRKLQEIAMQILGRGGNPISTIIQNLLNFTDKLLVQPQLDSAEYLRGRALQNGAISWTFGDLKLEVDYGIPAAGFLTSRTGNDAYIGSASKFWTDVRAIKQYLKYDVEAILVHPDTMDAVISNSVNNIEVTAQTDNSMSLSRIVLGANGGEKLSKDARDSVTLIAYGKEAEVLDTANPGSTVNVKFIDPGKMVGIGRNNGAKAFILQNGVDEGGGPPDPNLANALGYTHVGPTVEGDGRPGRWARIFRPEGRPWGIVGQSVSNQLPVIEAPEKICIATTTIS